MALGLLLIAAACTTPSAPVTLSPTSSGNLPPTSFPTNMPCMVINSAATPAPILGAEMGDRGHSTGPLDAPVTIVMFGDYQCANCAYLASTLEQIRQAHASDVRIIYIHFPQANHDKATLAIQAAEAADLQGKFWEMHNLLYSKQADWLNLSPSDFPSWAEKQAGSLGMDIDRYRLDYQGSVVAKRVKQAVDSASTIQQSLPILFINSGTAYAGRVDYSGLDQVVRLFALTRRQFTACPPMIIKPGVKYTATLHTDRGDILIDLFTDQSPLAVNNFIFLARSHWYDGNTFFKVEAGALAQTGDPSDSGFGNPGYFFQSEMPASLSFDQPGMVAMANSGPNTNASQFFITEAAAPDMNGQYTIFGKVIRGMEILTSLTVRDPNPGQELPPGDKLISVIINEP